MEINWKRLMDKWYILTPFSAILSYFAFAWMFGGFMLSGQVMIGIGMHELAHAVVILSLGIPIYFVFIPFLGGGVIPKDAQAIKDLHWKKMAIVTLAGPFMNVLLIIAALFLKNIHGLEKFMIMSIPVNLGLAWFNLLPIGILDGGRFIKTIMDSLNESYDRFVAIVVSIIAGAWGVYMVFVDKSYTYVLLIIGFTWMASKADNPNDFRSHQAMDRKTALLLVFAWVAILFSLMAIDMYVPSIKEVQLALYGG